MIKINKLFSYCCLSVFLIILYQNPATYCVSVIHDDTSLQSGKKNQVSLIVKDKRGKWAGKKVTGNVGNYINKSPASIVKTALKNALTANGYKLVQSADTIYHADIEEFSVDYVFGNAGEPVVANISLFIQIESSNGNLLSEKKISEKANNFISSIDPALSDVKKAMQNCLNSIVAKSVKDKNLIAAIQRIDTKSEITLSPSYTEQEKQISLIIKDKRGKWAGKKVTGSVGNYINQESRKHCQNRFEERFDCKRI